MEEGLCLTVLPIPAARASPMGLGTARAWVQSNGRLVRDQMTGCTFWVIFSEMATMEHVSCRTATRLGAARVSQRPPQRAPAPPQLPEYNGLTLARSGWAQRE